MPSPIPPHELVRKGRYVTILGRSRGHENVSGRLRLWGFEGGPKSDVEYRRSPLLSGKLIIIFALIIPNSLGLDYSDSMHL